MRILRDPPASVFDRHTHTLNAGSFRGGIPRVDPSLLARPPLFRILHEKRWVYATIVAGDLLVGTAIVHLGYASNAFAFVFDRASGSMLSTYQAVAPPFAARVGDTGQEGCNATFLWLGSHLSFSRGIGERDYLFEIRAPDLRLSARLSTEGMPPPIGAIVPIEGPPEGLFNATEKVVLLPVVGEVIAKGKHYNLDGGFGGLDLTSGFLARRTHWRWAFALGRARSAERVALNLVQGFVGPAECAVWVDGELYGVSEGIIEFPEGSPRSSWTVRTREGEVDLRFEPGAVHEEAHDFKVISSEFIQPTGSYSGTLRLPGREPLVLDGVMGVTEDQSVLW